MEQVVAIILGGGRGERLYPLTKHRAKPALPLAGKYRLIDIPVSNCINSEVLKIFILTQFNSASLNHHISNTYRFSPFMRGFVEVLAAQQTPESPDWFEGTADAVRKTLWVMEPSHADHYLVLAGDHLYRMDYRDFIRDHIAAKADISISVLPVDERAAEGFGLMKVDADHRVVEFREKPRGDDLREMKTDMTQFGFDRVSSSETPYLASMGIYLFSRRALIKLLLEHPKHTDFGRHIIPSAIADHHVRAFPFRGYWEDIGTIETFYKANLALVKQPRPEFSFYDAEAPIYSRPRFLPPSKILDSVMQESMVCDGCILRGSRIVNSIVGIRARMEANSSLENTLMMGADFYQSEAERASDAAQGVPPVGIGPNTTIRNAIVDKNARIGANVRIINKDNVVNIERETEGYWIRNGIVIVMKGTVIPDNTVI
jgi:glucose-1-phosphate adenylyltransferase